MLWRTDCPDWETRIVEGRSLLPHPPLYPDEALASLEMFHELKLVDVYGMPTLKKMSRKWTDEFVSSIFGAYNAETGRRLIREFFMLISKKNSKSTSAAGIMITALMRNWRNEAEFLVLAPTVEIANNCFSPARAMIKEDDELRKLLHVQSHIRTITHKLTGATLKVIAADSEAVGGKKATGILIDELWIFGKRPNADNMILEATGGLASRPEGFVIYLSTQSDEPPAGVFKQKLDYARDVRDGKIIDKTFLPLIYEFPQYMLQQKLYLKPENFYITNPNLGASVDVEFIENKFKQAANGEKGEDTYQGLLAKHLNVEIGMNLRANMWPGAEYWEQQGEPGITMETLIARCEIVSAGIDGGGLDDLLGLALAGREKGTNKWLAWTHAWAHPSVLKRRKSEAPRFEDFRQDRDLTFVEKIGQDVIEVADIISRVEASGKLDSVGVDPHGLGGILDALIAAGIEEAKIQGISQGWKMVGAIKTTERKLAEGTLIHGGQRMMNWCVGNAKVEQHGNAVSITKQSSGTAKIDPLMALFNAVTLLALNPKAAIQDPGLRWL